MRIHYTSDVASGYVNYEPEFADEGDHQLYNKIAEAIRRKGRYPAVRPHAEQRLALGATLSDGSMSVHRWASYQVDPVDLVQLRELRESCPALGPITDIELGV